MKNRTFPQTFNTQDEALAAAPPMEFLYQDKKSGGEVYKSSKISKKDDKWIVTTRKTLHVAC